MSTPLHGHIALVTGAAGGIGQAICRALAAEGATVALHYRTQKDAAHALAAELGGTAFEADITEAEAAQSLVERVAGELGGLDILVNNAGITIGGQFVADMELADWHRVLDVNLNSVLYMCKAALPLMRARGGGSSRQHCLECGQHAAGRRGRVCDHQGGGRGLDEGAVERGSRARHPRQCGVAGDHRRGDGERGAGAADAGGAGAISQQYSHAPSGRSRRGSCGRGLSGVASGQLRNGTAHKRQWRRPHRVLPIGLDTQPNSLYIRNIGPSGIPVGIASTGLNGPLL